MTAWTTAHQSSLSITNFRGLLRLMPTESVMPSSPLILCRPLLLMPSIFPSIRVFSNESALHIRWPKYWSFSFNISPTNEYPGLIRKNTKLNVEYQKIARRDMKALLNGQCKEVEETIQWERLKISSRKLELSREHFM